MGLPFFSKQQLSLKEAERILSDVPTEQRFVLENNQSIRNLHELERAIAHITQQTFEHHVTESKNDFATWVADVVQDYHLANAILPVHNNIRMAKVIRNRIVQLEKQIDKEHERIHTIEENIFSDKHEMIDAGLVVLCVILFVALVVLSLRLI